MSIISGPGITGKAIPPGFVNACCGTTMGAYNAADNCKQITKLCVDSAAVISGDFLEIKITTNANWCDTSYYNCSNGYENSYCGPMMFRMEQPDPPIWEAECAAGSFYEMLMRDYRLAGIVHMEIDPVDGCLVLYSRNPYWCFEIEIIDASGFVATVTTVSPPSLSALVPYGHVVVKLPRDCSEPERITMLPDEDNFEFCGIAIRCHELYDTCEDGKTGSAVEKTCERYYYKPGEKVHILTRGEVWVPLESKPSSLADKLSFHTTGTRGLLVPRPYPQPPAVGTIDLPQAKLLECSQINNLALIQIK